MRMRCLIPLRDQDAPRRIQSVRDDGDAAAIQAFDWPGVLLEAGRNDVSEIDDLTLAHHYLGLNTGPNPVGIDVKEEHGYRPVKLAPGSAWLVPAGQPFSIRVANASAHSYLRISIDALRFDRLVSTNEDDARPVSLRRRYDIGGPQVQHVIGALAAEASGGTPNGVLFVEALTTALGLQIVRQAGVAASRGTPARGGLAPRVRRRILELMHGEPSARLTIDTLAREAGLSPAHFARAFKESTGRAPHQYLMELRLAHARTLLDAPDATLSDVALRAGFADQAHFTRFFKRQFGVTPGAVLRSRWRSDPNPARSA
jgi:AraC family transcriptional regulator